MTKASSRSADKAVSIGKELAAGLLPRREQGAHKWGVGGLVIVAGSPGYAGAAVLCSLAAGRAGAGIVVLAAPRAVGGVVVSVVPEVVTTPLPEGEGSMGKKALEKLEEKIAKSAALVVGPGLGDDDMAGSLLSTLFGRAPAKVRIGFGFGLHHAPAEESVSGEALLVKAGKPLVIDADALNWLAEQENWPSMIPARSAVLTPHIGEMARLLKMETEEILADPAGTAKEAAAAWGQVVVLKGGTTVVSDGQRTLSAETPPSLATAGTGDVLAGAIGALLAQGLAPIDAAALAVYAGGEAARRVEARVGTLGLVAGDLPLAIAETLEEL
ncbi:MAG: ADP-dependent NAD(P)H-hydrate dehydratase [Thermomicrobiales bacterium]